MKKALFFLLTLSCAKVAPPPGKPELDGPLVRITLPAPGDTLSDTALVRVEAEDVSGVSLVKLMVDGHEVGSDSTEPFEIKWFTADLYDQQHALVAVALDTWDNQSTSDTVRVFTENGNEPPPDTSGQKPGGGGKGTK